MRPTDDRSPALRAVQALEESTRFDPLVTRASPLVAGALDRSPALAALGLVGAGGYLGGHMSFRLGAPPRGRSGPPTTRPTPDADEVDGPPTVA